MSMSNADSKSMEDRDKLTKEELDILDTAFGDMYFRGKHHGLKLAGDDRAAALEAAFIRFLLASRE